MVKHVTPTLVRSTVGAAHPVAIEDYLDSVGVEPNSRSGRGAFNIWGNAFPAEELPCGNLTELDRVPFRFPAADGKRPDHLRCRGQRIPLPAVRADWIHVLGAAERRTEDSVLVEYADGTVRRQWLRLSDFWPQTGPRFGERLAFRTTAMLYPRHEQNTMSPSIWHQRVPLAVADGLSALVLPHNPAMHLFALTLVTEAA
ncbi:hypothetical protein DSC45_23815 [Streptomyces sp. YIM 130001]|uniref:hypothetical protein n=1 Tax=Streptomyces sp. YIM 130001 TaxID=2259644 RepID=UPI000EE355DE|nr:hypothetical protein [Streptomyces sp. YIM 130001]RII13381.1 hypothetical protein DSC45_23815 [Streptomyces sp. YIM 130001]